MSDLKVTALQPWFGSNRILAKHVGESLDGCHWVGVPFVGGACELAHIKARTIHANDLHRHLINLANVVKDDELRQKLIRRLKRSLFHQEQLAESQDYCRENTPTREPDWLTAYHYFISGWMGRSHKAGIDDEFNGGLSIRWNANGGDSAVRYWNALRGLAEWGRIFRRCTFDCGDAFEFIARVEDADRHGLYVDPPFPGPGKRYKHNCGKGGAEQLAWHKRLFDSLSRFTKTCVVVRFYDHPMIRDLYLDWTWRELQGRTQANKAADEVLLLNTAKELSNGPFW